MFEIVHYRQTDRHGDGFLEVRESYLRPIIRSELCQTYSVYSSKCAKEHIHTCECIGLLPNPALGHSQQQQRRKREKGSLRAHSHTHTPIHTHSSSIPPVLLACFTHTHTELVKEEKGISLSLMFKVIKSSAHTSSFLLLQTHTQLSPPPFFCVCNGT